MSFESKSIEFHSTSSNKKILLLTLLHSLFVCFCFCVCVLPGRALEELRGSLYNDLRTSESAKRQQQRFCGPAVAMSFNFMVAVGIILTNKLVYCFLSYVTATFKISSTLVQSTFTILFHKMFYLVLVFKQFLYEWGDKQVVQFSFGWDSQVRSLSFSRKSHNNFGFCLGWIGSILIQVKYDFSVIRGDKWVVQLVRVISHLVHYSCNPIRVESYHAHNFNANQPPFLGFIVNRWWGRWDLITPYS